MISSKHKCIFIHVPKTAGQSIEQLFLKENNLTWEGRSPLLLKPNNDPAIGPERLAHLYANEYVKFNHISQADFDEFYKFSFVRNPFDRLVSPCVRIVVASVFHSIRQGAEVRHE